MRYLKKDSYDQNIPSKISMRNMARLWSLMTVSQPEAYDERENDSATCTIQNDAAEDASSRVDPSLEAYLEQSHRRAHQDISHLSAMEAVS